MRARSEHAQAGPSLPKAVSARSVAPWLWLCKAPRDGVALAVSPSCPDLAVELESHFATVHVLQRDFDALRPMSFDCIAVHDSFSYSDSEAGRTGSALVRLRAALKPDGYLVAASPNPYYHARRSLSASRGLPTRRLSRLLGRAGFTSISRIYVDGPLDGPSALIPDARAAALAYETTVAVAGRNGRLRLMLVRLGLWHVVYPSYYLIARG